MKIKIFIIVFSLSVFGATIIKAQSLDRITISSGAISNNSLSANLGEIFEFTVTNDGISPDPGSHYEQYNPDSISTSIKQKQINRSSMLVYPNPVQDYLNLQIKGTAIEKIFIQVYSLAGNLILTQNCVRNNAGFQINVTSLSAGNYFVSGYTAEGLHFGQIKFIKL